MGKGVLFFKDTPNNTPSPLRPEAKYILQAFEIKCLANWKLANVVEATYVFNFALVRRKCTQLY